MSRSKHPRKVVIEENGYAWLVRYVDRRPRQRHLAAQFDRGMKTRGDVEQWIEARRWPHPLILMNKL